MPFWRPGWWLLHWLPQTGRSSEGSPSGASPEPPLPSPFPFPFVPPLTGWRGCHGWSGRSSGGGAKGLSSPGPDAPDGVEEEEEGPEEEGLEEDEEEPGVGDWRSRISSEARSGSGWRKAVRRRSGMW